MAIKFKGYRKDIKKALPESDLPDNAVKFREPNSVFALNMWALLFSIPAILIVVGFAFLKRRIYPEQISLFYKLIISSEFYNLPVSALLNALYNCIISLLLFLLCIVPHELLHAIAFHRDADVDIYFTSSVALCYSHDVISKRRFIGLSLLPSFVLGILPLIVWLFIPPSSNAADIVYFTAALNFIAGAGDFMNVFNAMTQMPRGTYQQLSGFNSYWFYLPE
ncbi:MAG: DUF3267 domain-containing protein [Oscillospiraceae bacterium]|nr:DUF3267 domain-containing protein [Oscillospiraceae bacterium]